VNAVPVDIPNGAACPLDEQAVVLARRGASEPERLPEEGAAARKHTQDTNVQAHGPTHQLWLIDDDFLDAIRVNVTESGRQDPSRQQPRISLCDHLETAPDIQSGCPPRCELAGAIAVAVRKVLQPSANPESRIRARVPSDGRRLLTRDHANHEHGRSDGQPKANAVHHCTVKEMALDATQHSGSAAAGLGNNKAWTARVAPRRLILAADESGQRIVELG
jgi:hypothetical protein